MAKTVEYFTQTALQPVNGSKPVSLEEALREMSDLVDRVAQTLSDQDWQIDGLYGKRCVQLSLALAESRERFNDKAPQHRVALDESSGT